MTDIPKEWLQKIEMALIKSEQIPSLIETFSFPWDLAAETLARTLNIPDFKLSARPSQLKMSEDLLSGMGNEPVILTLELSPIAGHLQWIMSAEDIAYLTAYCLTSDHGHTFTDPRFQEGFYHFLALETILALDQLKVFKESSLRLLPPSLPVTENGMTLDVAISLSSKTLYGRIVCPQTFLSAFKEYQPFQLTSLFTREDVKKKEISLCIQGGSVSLSAEEWKGLMPGDWVILDHTSYDPESDKGSVMLALGDTPILRGRIKSDGLKILDYASYHEEMPAAEEAGSLLLSVEFGQLRISLEKLLALEVGGFLDILVQPQQGVDIALGGKKVARGELLKLGHTLGVRLLDIRPLA
jgi:hypothetical protein